MFCDDDDDGDVDDGDDDNDDKGIPIKFLLCYMAGKVKRFTWQSFLGKFKLSASNCDKLIYTSLGEYDVDDIIT